jgi:polyisoprenoid-binding protein YceI
MENSNLGLGRIRTNTRQELATWNIKYKSSFVRFFVSQLNLLSKPFRKIEGEFNAFTGSIKGNLDGFDNAEINFSLVANSIYTGNDRRDEILKSASFFNTSKFPTIRFKSAAFVREDDNKYILEGDFTIRNVTKRLVFDVVYGGEKQDEFGNNVAGFTIQARINRHDFGLRGNVLQDIFIGKEATISLYLEFIECETRVW